MCSSGGVGQIKDDEIGGICSIHDDRREDNAEFWNGNLKVKTTSKMLAQISG
jgi:hypothetical protein